VETRGARASAQLQEYGARIEGLLSDLKTTGAKNGLKITTIEEAKAELARLDAVELDYNNRLVATGADYSQVPMNSGDPLVSSEYHRSLKKSVAAYDVTFAAATDLLPDLKNAEEAREAKKLLALEKMANGSPTPLKDFELPTEGLSRTEREASRDRDVRLATELRQEKIRLDTQLLEIDKQLAAQDISSYNATMQKNAAQQESLRLEHDKIELMLKETPAKDKTQTDKLEGSLRENEAEQVKLAAQATKDYITEQTRNQNSIQSTRQELERYIEDLDFERQALGKSALETEHLRIERQRARDQEDLWNKLSQAGVTSGEFEAQSSRIDATAEAQRQDAEFQHSFAGGWAKAYDDYAKNAFDSAEIAKGAFQTATDSMTDMIVTFAETGKLTMRNFTISILKYFEQIYARQAALGLVKMFGSMVGSLFGGGVSTGYGGTAANVGKSYEQLYRLNAHGGVYDSPSLSAYKNGVYSSPQLFAFAHGAGVFGEAGPEAIMPLTRTPSGDLGVRTSGGGAGANNITVTNNVTVNSDGKSKSDSRSTGREGAELSRMLEAETIRIMTRELRPGGILYGA
jgi:lambda family phage tail tape measure protein